MLGLLVPQPNCDQRRSADSINVLLTGFGGEVSLGNILEFVDSGHNMLLATSSDVSDTMRTLAAEVGVDMDDKGTAVYDHFNHQLGDEQHTLIASSELCSVAPMLGKAQIQVRSMFI